MNPLLDFPKLVSLLPASPPMWLSSQLFSFWVTWNLIWHLGETLEVPCTEVSGHLDSGCHQRSPGPMLTGHYPALPAWLWDPQKASMVLAAVQSLKAQGCFLRLSFCTPKPPNLPNPNLSVCPVLGIQPLLLRCCREGYIAREEGCSGERCIVASAFGVSVVSSIE